MPSRANGGRLAAGGRAGWGLTASAMTAILFLHIPLAFIVLYAFNSSNIESWPISHFSLQWFAVAWHDQQVRSAFLLSVRVGLVQQGISRDLVGTAGFGESRPVATNGTASGRQPNRRVEIVVSGESIGTARQ